MKAEIQITKDTNGEEVFFDLIIKYDDGRDITDFQVISRDLRLRLQDDSFQGEVTLKWKEANTKNRPVRWISAFFDLPCDHRGDLERLSTRPFKEMGTRISETIYEMSKEPAGIGFAETISEYVNKLEMNIRSHIIKEQIKPLIGNFSVTEIECVVRRLEVKDIMEQ